MRLDDEQELTLPQMLESARSFPKEVTLPDPDIATTSLLGSGASKGAITIPDCCISLVDGPLVGLTTSDGLQTALNAKSPGPLDGPGNSAGAALRKGPRVLDARDALEQGLVEGVSAGTRA
jgi:hypothetical protein